MQQSFGGNIIVAALSTIPLPSLDQFTLFFNSEDSGKLYSVKNIAGSKSIFNYENSPAVNGGYSKVDFFVPTVYGQTIFFLSAVYNVANNPILTVNGQEQQIGLDYNAFPNRIVFLNSSYFLDTTDNLDFYYN